MTDPTPSGRDPSSQDPPTNQSDPQTPNPQPENAEPAEVKPDDRTNGGDRPSERASNAGGREKPRTVVARYGLMRFTGEFRHNLKAPPVVGQHVVARTDRGVELAKVITPVCTACAESPEGIGCISSEKLENFLAEEGPNYPFRRGGKILRPANPQDLIDYRHLQQSAKEEGKYCREQIEKMNLPMRLVTVEHLLGGERIVFYFTSEKRVDFRQLVRNLASQFRTRIEMRQVGARDEARLVADYERCGQRCCCQEFLKDLKPVSMRMAKVQKATLDPSKISGRCGRLMCCLRYEDETYEHLRKRLPRKNTWVRTEQYLGRVVDTQIITQLVRISLPDNTLVAVGVEELLERDLDPPTEEQLRAARANHAAARREKIAQAAAEISPGPEESHEKGVETKGDQQPSGDDPGKGGKDTSSKSRKRRRRRKKKKPSGQQGSGGKSGDKSGGGASKSKKRRRRRKKNKPSGGKGGGNSSGS